MTDISNINFCDIYRTLTSQTDNLCQCSTSRNRVCKNKHKFKYSFSNGQEMRTCGISKHRKIAMNKGTGNITVNISKLLNTFEHDNSENVTNEYKIIAVNVNWMNDHECPLVSNSTPPVIMKHILKQAQDQNKLSEHFVRKTIQTLKKLLKDEENKLYHFLRIDNEYRLALYHMRFNTAYIPSNKSIGESNEICAICHEKLDASNSSILYECNHAFHNHCIRQWFQNKETINCPCCRKECDVDNYFRYSRYRPLN